ncbi:hypothetical protein RvY_07374 [Ramazzottius varieornatus]|uniref:Uncharacterized protein n=1 Tax=Ramazzottius varieornatus TaxID=947166 RepID=A0A1D1V821_RAMVA|nr:hypothetical protein RvY_07374 [Ramazzottius varieornatus]
MSFLVPISVGDIDRQRLAREKNINFSLVRRQILPTNLPRRTRAFPVPFPRLSENAILPHSRLIPVDQANSNFKSTACDINSSS